MSHSSWKFHNPVRVCFGRGSRTTLAEELAGKRCLIVTSVRGRAHMVADPQLSAWLAEAELCWADGVTANPDAEWLEAERTRLRDERFDAVVGFGGGSAIDSAKVLAVSLAEPVRDLPLKELLASPALHAQAKPAPLYAVPTTAGTGSEVTPFSTVWDHAIKKKFSLAGPVVYPKVAIVDPDLLDDLPAEVTLSTGLDAINQAAESIWNRNMSPVSEGFATRALQLGFDALPRLMKDPSDRAAREAMAECSVLAGMAISQTRTALCHSISYPITAHYGVPHGLACAFTMPAVLRLNLQADDGRFARLATALQADSMPGILTLFVELCRVLAVRSHVARHVPSLEALLALSGEMFTPGRVDNNLAPVDVAVVSSILVEAWDG